MALAPLGVPKPLRVAEVEVTPEATEVLALGAVAVVNESKAPNAKPSLLETIAQ